MPSPNAFVATMTGVSPVVNRRCVEARTDPGIPAWYGSTRTPAARSAAAVSSTLRRVRA